jgi:hypothetical protein
MRPRVTRIIAVTGRIGHLGIDGARGGSGTRVAFERRNGLP